MSDELLSSLCAICHVNLIKYTCPRCRIKTCSLPCIKRHKLWSQCSGVRDPTAYRKRTDLATPASIDQDFNFITLVERKLQRADDDAAERGIDLLPGRLNTRDKSRLNHEIAKAGVIVIKVPIGLSRSKANRTRWDSNGKGLLWTVEWILPDGRKIFVNSQATKSLKAAFQNSVGIKAVGQKRKIDAVGDHTASSKTVKEDRNSSIPDANSQGEVQARNESEIDGLGSTNSPLDNEKGQAGKVDSGRGSRTDPLKVLHFYLHRPNTPSKFKCVIPIDPSKTLGEVLRERLVLEFPTIYITHESPDMLEEPLIAEERYDNLYGKHGIVELPPPEVVTAGNDHDNSTNREIDEKKILEVLQKDLRTRDAV